MELVIVKMAAKFEIIFPYSANLQMLQKLPAIGPKTAFILHRHRELHGPFISLETLKNIPGLQKSFFNKFVKTHQIVL